jgi:hypothetical protein
MPTVREKEQTEKIKNYEELKKNSMTQEQCEELTKIDEKMPDPVDYKSHNKWLNKKQMKTCLGELQQEEMRKEDIYGLFQTSQEGKEKETVMEKKENKKPMKDPTEEKSMMLPSNIYNEREPTKQEERDELLDPVKVLPEEKIPVHLPLNSNITAKEQSTQEEINELLNQPIHSDTKPIQCDKWN